MTPVHLIAWMLVSISAWFGVARPAYAIVQDTTESLRAAGVIAPALDPNAPLVRGHVLVAENGRLGFQPCGEPVVYPLWIRDTDATRRALPYAARQESRSIYVEVRGTIGEITDHYAYAARERYERELLVVEVLQLRVPATTDCRPRQGGA